MREIKTLIDRDAYLKIKRIRLKQKTLTQPLVSITLFFATLTNIEKILLIILFVVTFVLLGWYTSKNLPKNTEEMNGMEMDLNGRNGRTGRANG